MACQDFIVNLNLMLPRIILVVIVNLECKSAACQGQGSFYVTTQTTNNLIVCSRETSKLSPRLGTFGILFSPLPTLLISYHLNENPRVNQPRLYKNLTLIKRIRGIHQNRHLPSIRTTSYQRITYIIIIISRAF